MHYLGVVRESRFFEPLYVSLCSIGSSFLPSHIGSLDLIVLVTGDSDQSFRIEFERIAAALSSSRPARPSLAFIFVDTDVAPDLMKRLAAAGSPSLLFFHKGTKVRARQDLKLARSF
jgi:hypothetical protein